VGYFIGVSALMGFVVGEIAQPALAGLSLWQMPVAAIGFTLGVLTASALFCRLVPLRFFLTISGRGGSRQR
jgi:hypothetical protein